MMKIGTAASWLASFPRQRVVQFTLAATVALLANGIAASPQRMTALASGAAYAQEVSGEFSDAQVQSYAVAVVNIDASREEALANVQAQLEAAGLSTNQVDLSCTNTRSLNRLPSSIRAGVRETVVDFCNYASDVVEDSGLSVEQFNAITAAHQNNPQLAERIAIAITRLQTP